MIKTISKYISCFEENSSKLEKYAPSVLRIGMSLVILWFSSQQFLDAESWTIFVPERIVSLSGISALNLVYFNALFELVFGALLILGIQTRISALLLSLHLFQISFIVGYSSTGVRDFGLALATFVVFMNGKSRDM